MFSNMTSDSPSTIQYRYDQVETPALPPTSLDPLLDSLRMASANVLSAHGFQLGAQAVSFSCWML